MPSRAVFKLRASRKYSSKWMRFSPIGIILQRSIVFQFLNWETIRAKKSSLKANVGTGDEELRHSVSSEDS